MVSGRRVVTCLMCQAPDCVLGTQKLTCIANTRKEEKFRGLPTYTFP
jgi:hypothetical protein